MGKELDANGNYIKSYMYFHTVWMFWNIEMFNIKDQFVNIQNMLIMIFWKKTQTCWRDWKDIGREFFYGVSLI